MKLKQYLRLSVFYLGSLVSAFGLSLPAYGMENAAEAVEAPAVSEKTKVSLSDQLWLIDVSVSSEGSSAAQLANSLGGRLVQDAAEWAHVQQLAGEAIQNETLSEDAKVLLTSVQSVQNLYLGDGSQSLVIVTEDPIYAVVLKNEETGEALTGDLEKSTIQADQDLGDAGHAASDVVAEVTQANPAELEKDSSEVVESVEKAGGDSQKTETQIEPVAQQVVQKADPFKQSMSQFCRDVAECISTLSSAQEARQMKLSASMVGGNWTADISVNMRQGESAQL